MLPARRPPSEPSAAPRSTTRIRKTLSHVWATPHAPAAVQNPERDSLQRPSALPLPQSAKRSTEWSDTGPVNRQAVHFSRKPRLLTCVHSRSRLPAQHCRDAQTFIPMAQAHIHHEGSPVATCVADRVKAGLGAWLAIRAWQCVAHHECDETNDVGCEDEDAHFRQ